MEPLEGSPVDPKALEVENDLVTRLKSLVAQGVSERAFGWWSEIDTE
jgi:hypothetical protein